MFLDDLQAVCRFALALDEYFPEGAAHRRVLFEVTDPTVGARLIWVWRDPVDGRTHRFGGLGPLDLFASAKSAGCVNLRVLGRWWRQDMTAMQEAPL